MYLEAMNLIITGRPRSGKTTLVKEIISILSPSPLFGFYTEELRVGGERMGFILRTLGGEERLLAHVDLKGRYRVGKYGVDLNAISLGIREIERGIKEDGLIIIDEIGKMELLLPKFREIVPKALDSKSNLLATMGIIKDPFINGIGSREDVELLILRRENYEDIKGSILKRINAGSK